MFARSPGKALFGRTARLADRSTCPGSNSAGAIVPDEAIIAPDGSVVWPDRPACRQEYLSGQQFCRLKWRGWSEKGGTCPVATGFAEGTGFPSKIRSRRDKHCRPHCSHGIAPDGASIAPDGASIAPDGASIAPDGAQTAPDEASIAPDGSVVWPEHRRDRAGWSVDRAGWSVDRAG